MPIVVQCSGCQQHLRLKDEHAGKTFKCPACGQSLTAIAAKERPPSEMQAPLPAAEATEPAGTIMLRPSRLRNCLIFLATGIAGPILYGELADGNIARSGLRSGVVVDLALGLGASVAALAVGLIPWMILRRRYSVALYVATGVAFAVGFHLGGHGELSRGIATGLVTGWFCFVYCAGKGRKPPPTRMNWSGNMIDFKCEKCGESLSVPDSLVGEVEKCPSCGTNVSVPGSKQAAKPKSNRHVIEEELQRKEAELEDLKRKPTRLSCPDSFGKKNRIVTREEADAALNRLRQWQIKNLEQEVADLRQRAVNLDGGE